MAPIAHILTLIYGSFLAIAHANSPEQDKSMPDLPPQAVFVDPKSFAVLGRNFPFHQSSNDLFNPTNTTIPFFQVFDSSFITNILGGPEATINLVASNNTFPFAHEAPVYNAPTDEVFFTSGANFSSFPVDISSNYKVGKISMKNVENALNGKPVGAAVNVPVTELDIDPIIQKNNGGTGPYKGNLVFVTNGNLTTPPVLALVKPTPPYNVTVLLDNYYGRQFNALDDVRIHPNGNIFFTDIPFGFELGYRPSPLLPNQVYSFDPKSGIVHIAATDFQKPNGIAFSKDGKTAYVTDTGIVAGIANQTSTIYAFDVDFDKSILTNRRVFTFVDTGFPDGALVDFDGNVYAGCGDGVHVWNSAGTLLGKFFVGSYSANMVFAGDGRLVILAETEIYVAHIQAKGIPPLFA